MAVALGRRIAEEPIFGNYDDIRTGKLIVFISTGSTQAKYQRPIKISELEDGHPPSQERRSNNSPLGPTNEEYTFLSFSFPFISFLQRVWESAGSIDKQEH